jgi:hypothetical protein
MRKSSRAEQLRRRRDQRPSSTQFPVHDTSDPAIGDALIRQLMASIGEGGLVTVEHRGLAASLRRHLDHRVDAVRAELANLPPRFEMPLQHLVDAVQHAAARGAAIEDAVAHGLVTGGLLGELERVVIRRMLSSIATDLEAVRVGLVEAAMDAAWIDHGGRG